MGRGHAAVFRATSDRMNQRQAIVLAMRFRPRWVRRRTWANVAANSFDFCNRQVWRVRNPRFAWFAARVRWHYAYGLPMPAKPPHSVEV